MTLDLRCIRVSDEAFDMLGLYPQQLTNRSLFDLVDNPQPLTRIHRALTDNLTDNKVTITFHDFFSSSPYQLATVANGSLTLKEILAFKRANGGLSLLDTRLYFGGGLGADLFLPHSLDRLYLVCILTKPRTNNSYCPPTLSSSPVPARQQQTSHPSPVTDDELLWAAASSSEATLSPSSTSCMLFTSASDPIPASSENVDDTELVWMQPPDNVIIPLPLCNAAVNNNAPCSIVPSTQNSYPDSFYLSSSSVAAEPQYYVTPTPLM